MTAGALAAWIIGGCAGIALLFAVAGLVRLAVAGRRLNARVASIEERTKVFASHTPQDDVARVAAVVRALPAVIERAKAALAHLQNGLAPFRSVAVAVAAVRNSAGL